MRTRIQGSARLSEAESKRQGRNAATRRNPRNKAEENSAKAKRRRRRGSLTHSERIQSSISLILQGTYEHVAGSQHIRLPASASGGEVGPKRSFGLGETELNISANIDPYFRGVAIASPRARIGVSRGGMLFRRWCRAVLRSKGALFFRYRLSEQHQHAWDFGTRLLYKASWVTS
jgi:hypothetical protein